MPATSIRNFLLHTGPEAHVEITTTRMKTFGQETAAVKSSVFQKSSQLITKLIANNRQIVDRSCREEMRKTMNFKKTLAAIAVTSLVAPAVWATNGYAPHGIGAKTKGMGGAGVAFPQDALAGGVNPAGMAFLGTRLDIGLDYFRPQRTSKIKGNQQPPPPQGLGNMANGTFDGDHTEDFLIPSFGYNHQISEKMTLGVSMFGNGGMNTDYNDGIPMFNVDQQGKSKRTGIDFAQLFIVPTFTYKINQNHALGIGLNLVGQRIKLRGLENFDNPFMTSKQGKVTGNGYDYSYGYGVRIGWTGKITDRLTLGATYQTESRMSKFDDYKGLLAEEGKFNIPANYAIGAAFKVTPKLTIAADVMRIMYGDINSIANKGPAGSMGPPGATGKDKLGDDDGWGFGWDDQWVYKIGVAYEATPEWTFRAGYNHGSAPYNDSQTLFNILAPAVVEDHMTLGATWKFAEDKDITIHYMHAFENDVKGSNGSIPAWLGGGKANNKMYQDEVGIAFGWKL